MCGEASCTFYKGNVKKSSAISRFLKEDGFSSVVTVSFTELGILAQSTSFHRILLGLFFVFKKCKITENQEPFKFFIVLGILSCCHR